MSCVVYQVDKKTGVKYAYESVSYWDKEKQQPRSKREYIGKVDPETGKIIPKKGRRVPSEEASASDDEKFLLLHDEIKRKDEELKELRKELKEYKNKYSNALDTLQKIQKLIKEA